ncbi:hypothetical protein [Kinneretia aquatilis]|uniref:hypothetical protein n=1 Tax=Kinneretia aquatilis TaxID=2070761 RepID=UPI0014953A45|nr:hypothetical protein [Paucibacter aquatile]WIV98261.1 hypothetical protein K9V56_001760 [Paucibacter aquatile]
MWSWLTRKTERSEGQALLQRLRERYPVYAAPHAYRRDGQLLSLAQAQENLEYLQTQRPTRLRIASDFLHTEAGVDVAVALAGAEPAALLDGLHRWSLRVFPALQKAAPQLARDEVWLASDRRGPEIVYSLLMDLALLLGELILIRRPAFQWALDLDEGNLLDGMDSVRRPVLQFLPTPTPTPTPTSTSTSTSTSTAAGDASMPPVQLDVEALVVHRYREPDSPSLQWMNGWAQLVQDARSGAYERVF